MSELEHEFIQYLLKSRACNYDMAFFRKYVNGDISLQKCKEAFIKYNKVSSEDADKLTDKLFIEWLASIGWVRL